MIKKIILILLLGITSLSFSQEKQFEGLFAAPNPFTFVTNIYFKASKPSTAYLSVRNVLGKTVFKRELTVTIGKNSIPFYKNDLPSGIYIYSILNKNKIISKRFVIR